MINKIVTGIRVSLMLLISIPIVFVIVFWFFPVILAAIGCAWLGSYLDAENKAFIEFTFFFIGFMGTWAWILFIVNTLFLGAL